MMKFLFKPKPSIGYVKINGFSKDKSIIVYLFNTIGEMYMENCDE